MLLQEESHKDLNKTHTSIETMAFTMDKWKPSPTHKNNTSSKKRTYFCDHCKIPGHSISRCFKLHGYPNRNKHPPNKKYAAAIQHDAYSYCVLDYTAADVLHWD